MIRKRARMTVLSLLLLCCLLGAAFVFITRPSRYVNEDVVAPDSLPVKEPIVNDTPAPDDEPEPADVDIAEAARALMAVYPVSYVRSGDAEPTYMELADWAAACLRYVDPSSALGQALSSNPDSVAAPLGYYEVASYTKDTEVTEVAGDSVTVKVTIEGTQQDWGHTMTFDESFVVRFNEAGLVTEIVDAA